MLPLVADSRCFDYTCFGEIRLLALRLSGILLITCSVTVAEDIGGAKQLFIDDQIIHSLGSAQRVFKRGEKLGPLLSANTAWETKRSLAYPTVRRESADSWKMWYRSGTPAGERAICYAISTDGINWTKPSLGIYPHRLGDQALDPQLVKKPGAHALNKHGIGLGKALQRGLEQAVEFDEGFFEEHDIVQVLAGKTSLV